MSRVRTPGEAPLFFLSCFFSVSLIFLYPSVLSFQFIHLSIHFRCQNSEISIFIYHGKGIFFVEHFRGDVWATQCLLTAAKDSKCGVIHRGQWENCYGRDTKRIKMHQFCITKLWAPYEQQRKQKIRNTIICGQIIMNTPTEWKIGPRITSNIFRKLFYIGD